MAKKTAKKITQDEMAQEALNPSTVISEPVVTPSIINRFRNQEGLRALRLELENFKGIRNMIVDIGGRSMLIMGKNNVGKSTVIQAMKSPLNVKLLPSDPITTGEEKAKISFTIGGSIGGEYKEYIANLRFTQNNKSGTLTVTNEAGEQVKSPATILKTFISTSSFSITSWLAQDKPKRLELLKNLTGKGKEIDLVNMEIKRIKDQRKIKNDRAEELEGSLKNHGMTQDEISKYSVPAPIEALQQEMNLIVQNQQTYDGVINQLNQLYVDVQNIQNNIVKREAECIRIENEIKRLNGLLSDEITSINNERQSIAATQQRILNGEEWKRNAGERPSLDSVNQRLSEAGAHNEKYNRISQLSAQQQEMIKLKQEVDSAKGDIETQEKLRDDLISKSQLPVEGLSFTDDEIYLNGLPFEDEQINTATRFDVGAEIAMALNPTLKIIFLDDASLFDKQHLRAIISKIEQRGYQVIAELVAESDEVQAVFTEEELK